RFSAVRIIGLQVEQRCLPLCSHEVLQRAELKKLARSPALRDYPAHAKIVVENFDRVANLEPFRAGQHIVHNDVVSTLKATSAEIAEWPAQAFITLQIDARDHFECPPGRNLGDDGGDRDHVRQSGQHTSNLDRGWRAGQSYDKR